MRFTEVYVLLTSTGDFVPRKVNIAVDNLHVSPQDSIHLSCVEMPRT